MSNFQRLPIKVRVVAWLVASTVTVLTFGSELGFRATTETPPNALLAASAARAGCAASAGVERSPVLRAPKRS